MKKSNVYEAIIKIKEYCRKQRECEACELSYVDEWDEYICCSLRGTPMGWYTDDIPFNILEEE